jgi:hypothetical protein
MYIRAGTIRMMAGYVKRLRLNVCRTTISSWVGEWRFLRIAFLPVH